MPQPPSRHTVTFKIGDQPVPGYRLARELGRGTFGVVWLAVTENGFERALKVVNLEQKGGKKEFRALRLIKDRKILHGNLLTLIDYWLLDRDGTILSTPNNILVDTHQPMPKAGNATSPGTVVSGERPQAQVKKLTPGMQGTMIPGHDSGGEENFRVRDTFQQLRNTDTTAEENSQAIWLVVAMELGHKTLHDRQKEHTQALTSKNQSKVARKGATQVDNKDDTAAGSNTVADRKAPQQGNEDDDLSPLPADEVLPYMEQAARGLDYLHRCEIVHRDVKPQNIMLVGDVAKVCDYGLASELGDIRATTNAFTLPYAAPEAINKNQPTPASDQYSLAVTYVELRTGRWPFVSNTSTAVYAAKDTGHHHLKFVPNRNVRAVLKKALAKRPEDRFPSCGEFVKQLAKAEATKFSLFATAQAILAILAIVTVLLAASATHPDIRAYLLSQLSGTSLGAFDLADYRDRLQSAEALLEENHSGALKNFTSLQGKLGSLPKEEIELRDRTLLGLARAQAGEKDYLLSKEQKEGVLALVGQLSTSPSVSTNAERTWQTHYLRFISGGEAAIANIGPKEALAEEYLFEWERELWRTALVYDAPLNIRESLNKIIDWRKNPTPSHLEQAREELKKLQEELDADPDIAENVRHLVAIEALHLRLWDDQPQHDRHLESLTEFVNQQAKIESELLDRAHLLRLLVIGRDSGGVYTYNNSEIALSINSLKPDVFASSKLAVLKFSDDEAAELVQVRDQLRDESRSFAESLSAREFAPLKQLCSKQEGYALLCQRLRGFLPTAEMPNPAFEPIRQAAGDLQVYLEKEYLLSDLTGTEQQAAMRERADLRLEVSFVDPSAEPDAVLKDFVKQVVESGDTVKWFKRLLDKAGDPKWTKAAAIPLRHFIANPTPDLTKHPQFAAWQRTFESLHLRDTWLLDPDPNDPAAIQKILDSLKGGPDSRLAVNAGPLPSLIQLECEIITTTAPTTEKFRDWDSRLERALSAAETDPSLTAYGNFVRARRLAMSDADSDQQEAAKLVEAALSAPSLPIWLAKSRLQGAGDVLAVAAIRSLSVQDSSVLRFADLSLSTNPQLARWQEAANKAGLQIPALQAAAAIVQATQGSKMDWAEIHRLATAAQQDPKTVALFERNQASRVLEYVSAQSALNSTPASSLPSPEVIRAFQHLLVAKEKDKYLYFEYATGQTNNDERVLQNLINPVLSRVIDRPDAAAIKSLPAKELAFLWGAKGRLLQRNPYIIRVDPAKEKDSRDSTVVAAVQANLAFDNARQLDDHLEYLVGYCRTLMGLPEAPKSRGGTLKEITDLIAKRTPEEKLSNLGLRYLVAYTARFNAYPTDNIKEIEAAERLYKALHDELPEQDPLGLIPFCREGLSDIHLRLGFLTEVVTAREVRQLLAMEEPAPNTKAYHLRLAVSYGQSAVQSSHLSQNEDAYIALANAYEDYAYYLGVPGAYDESRKHFLSGIGSAKERGLPLAKARLNYGRCMFRHATDQLVDLSLADRKSTLEEAVLQLNEALKADTLRSEDEVEARLWLAETKWALANRTSDNKPRFELYEEAMESYRATTSAAQAHRLTKFQMVAMSRESDNCEVLCRVYDQTKTKDIIRRPVHFNRAVELDDLGYRLFAANPAQAQPRYVGDLAGNSVLTSVGNRQQQLRWLEGTPAIAQQWNANDEWRLAAVLLRLVFALQQNHEQAELAAARAILPTFVDKNVQQKALVRILEFEATRKCASFNDSIGKNPGIKPEQEAALAEQPLAAMLEALRVRDQILESAVAAGKRDDVKDLETKELLDRINQMSSASLPKFGQQLTPIQKKKLYIALTTAPNVLFRIHVAKLCKAMINAADKDPKLAAVKTDRARVAHDSIKPFFVFNDDEMTALGLDGLKRSQQNALDGFERDLKAAGVKFEVFAGP